MSLIWLEAWRARVQSNTITRMRFAGLRYVVYLRRKPKWNPRITMGFDEVRI